MKIFAAISYVFMMIGVLAMSFATIGSVGYFLYEWGKLGMEIGPAAWEAFVIWMELVAGGVLVIILGGIFYVLFSD